MQLQVVKEKVWKKKWFGLKKTFLEEYAIYIDGECHGLEETEAMAWDRGRVLVKELKKAKEDAIILDKLLKERGITFEESYALLWWTVKEDYVECQIDGYIQIKR